MVRRYCWIVRGIGFNVVLYSMLFVSIGYVLLVYLEFAYAFRGDMTDMIREFLLKSEGECQDLRHNTKGRRRKYGKGG